MPYTQLIHYHIEQVKTYANNLPGIVLIHNAQNNFQRLEYISDRGLQFLQASQEYLTNLGHEYYVKYFNQEDIWKVMEDMQAMLSRKDPNEVFNFYHQARPNENVEWTWFLFSMKILEFDNEGNPLLTIGFAQDLDPNYSVTYKVDKLLEEKVFSQTHKDIFDNLSKREIEILKLVAKGKTSDEISEICFISIETVKTHRKHINQKLNANSITDLQNFARAFNLI